MSLHDSGTIWHFSRGSVPQEKLLILLNSQFPYGDFLFASIAQEKPYFINENHI